MSNSAAKNPLIKQGWLRALVFCAFYVGLLLLVAVLVNKLVTQFKQEDIQSGAVTDAKQLLGGQLFWVTALASLVVSLLAVFLFRRFIDKQRFDSLGFAFADYLPDALTGLFLAPVLIGLGTLILFLSGRLQWTDITFNGNDLFISLGTLGIIALAEEIVFRGYILNNLLQSFNKWLALIISSVVFAAFHFNNPDTNIIPLVNLFLAGILLGINYIYTRNLWFAVFFHTGWNFFMGPVLGYPVSGIGFSSVLQVETNADVLFTGGAFGFEGSVFLTALLVIAILLMAWIYERKFQTPLQPA